MSQSLNHWSFYTATLVMAVALAVVLILVRLLS